MPDANCAVRAVFLYGFRFNDSEKGVSCGKSEPAEEEAAQDVQEKVGEACPDFFVENQEGEELHGVGGEGGESAEKAGGQEELVPRLDFGVVSEVHEEEAEEEGADQVDQNGAVRIRSAAVFVGEKGDSVAEDGACGAAESDQKYFVHDASGWGMTGLTETVYPL